MNHKLINIYVQHGEDKILLNSNARTRKEFETELSGKNFKLNDSDILYSSEEVFAEPNVLSPNVAGCITGFIMFIFHPLLAVIGFFLGYIMGEKMNEKEKLAADLFNNS